jgi:hypothetical protein
VHLQKRESVFPFFYRPKHRCTPRTSTCASDPQAAPQAHTPPRVDAQMHASHPTLCICNDSAPANRHPVEVHERHNAVRLNAIRHQKLSAAIPSATRAYASVSANMLAGPDGSFASVLRIHPVARNKIRRRISGGSPTAHLCRAWFRPRGQAVLHRAATNHYVDLSLVPEGIATAQRDDPDRSVEFRLLRPLATSTLYGRCRSLGGNRSRQRDRSRVGDFVDRKFTNVRGRVHACDLMFDSRDPLTASVLDDRYPVPPATWIAVRRWQSNAKVGREEVRLDCLVLHGDSLTRERGLRPFVKGGGGPERLPACPKPQGPSPRIHLTPAIASLPPLTS